MTPRAHRLANLLLAVATAASLAACGGNAGASAAGTATGADFQALSDLPADSAFDADAAEGQNGALIDISRASEGYVGASATAQTRLKLVVAYGQYSQNYDLPADGTPIIAPLTSGNGTYLVRVMQNTTGNSYVELARAEAEVALDDEFAPYLRPNVYCAYSSGSACVSRARELVSGASNQGEALAAVCGWIVENITYDEDKAAQLSGQSGYVPDPDATLASGTGICFDYACLGAAMLRSQGIPTQIVTGNVSPGDIYHAWINVYIDGTWASATFDVRANTWSLVDLTFAAGGSSAYVGDGETYTPRYVY